MALAMALLPCLNASAKYLGRSYSTVEIVWARYAGHFAYMVVAFFPRRGLALFATSHPWIQVLRSALLLSATGVYFTALHYTDLPTAAIISFVSPFIMIALAALTLGETVGPRRWAAVGVGFLGAVFILRPGLGAVPPASFLLFVGLGLFGGFGHYFIVKALEWGPASVIAPLNYGQLIGTVILGYVVFAEFPDLWTWLGAAVIIGSGLYIFYRERRLQRRAQ